MRRITRADIDAVCKPSVWDFGNSVLYDLCRKHPDHTCVEEIIAKVWIVGRSYSAALERRRKANKTGDDFYRSVVGPKMLAAGIDSWFAELCVDASAGCAASLVVHSKLQTLFHGMTGLQNRSLASKYLHFHFPDTFFLYDSRAVLASKKVAPRLQEISDIPAILFDREYKKLVRRCVWLRNRIHEVHSIWLTPRQLDTLLLSIADNELKRGTKSPGSTGSKGTP